MRAFLVSINACVGAGFSLGLVMGYVKRNSDIHFDLAQYLVAT
jgi:hypothetical protein